MWVKGSTRRSITVLSTSVISPIVTRRTFFPVASAASRMMRCILWKTGFSGWARMAMTLSWMPDASCLIPSSPFETSLSEAIPALSTAWESIASMMTSSPMRLISRSTRSRFTRMVAGGAADAAASEVGAGFSCIGVSVCWDGATGGVSALGTCEPPASWSADAICLSTDGVSG
jgi:hypothetical protein